MTPEKITRTAEVYTRTDGEPGTLVDTIELPPDLPTEHITAYLDKRPDLPAAVLIRCIAASWRQNHPTTQPH